MVIFSKLKTPVEVKTPDISNLGSTFSVTYAWKDEWECKGSHQDSNLKGKYLVLAAGLII